MISQVVAWQRASAHMFSKKKHVPTNAPTQPKQTLKSNHGQLWLSPAPRRRRKGELAACSL